MLQTTMEKQMPAKTDDGSTPRLLNVWSLASEIGVILAAPLVILVIIAVKIDKYLGTLPLFIIIAIIASMVISTVAIARKIKQLNL